MFRVREHIFVYSKLKEEVRYTTHSASTMQELNRSFWEILDRVLYWDDSEICARYPDAIPIADAYDDFCKYIKYKFSDAVIKRTCAAVWG